MPKHATRTADILSLADERRIDALCDSFEKLHKAGRPRSIESFLEEAEAAIREYLLEELLRIEFADDRKRGSVPNLDDYYRRFERFGRRPVDEAFSSMFEDVKSDVNGELNRKRLPCRFGKFELLEELGAGGMGVIYRAFDTELRREVALKMVRTSCLSSPDAVDRFRSEAIASARFDHPGLVPIYDIQSERGQHYITMPLVDGVDRERLPFRREYQRVNSSICVGAISWIVRIGCALTNRGDVTSC